MGNFQTGSQWRKWDLHIHTPVSFHWKGGKHFSEMLPAEKEQTLEQICAKITESDVAAFGIMDYWTFDGYLDLLEFTRRRKIHLGKAVFPGMELRVEAPVPFRLNIHLLLSDDLTKQQLSDVKSSIIVAGIDRPLSDEALIAFAKTLAPDVAAKYGFKESDVKNDKQLFHLGAITAKVTKDSLLAVKDKAPKDSCLIILPFETSDGLESLEWEKHPSEANEFMQAADIFESRNQKFIDLILGRRTDQNKGFIDNFIASMGGDPKPAISGSDAHKVSDYGVYPSNRITWIKANTTFAGLRQTTYEPEARTYIGELPEKLLRVNTARTKYVDSVSITKKAGSTLPDIWFDNSIPLNHDLVAIIGNKGSGKSALADTLGLLGNSKQQARFCFLHPDKFANPRNNLANHFEAKLTWASGVTSESVSLSAIIDSSFVETIKYIPQHFFEHLCSEVPGSEEDAFERELKNVIFSHVDVADRLGYEDLDSLVNYKTEETSNNCGLLKEELRAINERIIEIEHRGTSEYRKTLENLVAAKKEELRVHDESKPKAVPKVDTQSPEVKAISSKIDELKLRAKTLSEQIEKARADSKQYAKALTAAQRVLERIVNFQRQLTTLRKDSEADLAILGIPLDKVVSLTVNTGPLTTLSKQYTERRTEIAKLLSESDPKSLYLQKTNVEEQIKQLQQQLDAPSLLYQTYLQAHAEWETKRAEIIGDETSEGSIQHLESALQSLTGIPAELDSARTERIDKVKEIHAEIRRLAEVYRDLYKPLQERISSNPLVKDKLGLNFEVSIENVGFSEDLFDHIDQRKARSFQGATGKDLLKTLIDKFDFRNEESTLAFLSEIMEHLGKEKEELGSTVIPLIERQLRDGRSLQSLYDMVFSLDYLRPRYTLNLGSKELHTLSPGERGALLLIFYLLVDKGDIPLLIDQPEENLDNQTVYDLLVPCIKEAKQRRQVIIVTHNPNLAVVCDAEQIIYASHKPTDKNRIAYETGAIEDPAINKRIVDVLEGTLPAFDNRGAKYHHGRL